MATPRVQMHAAALFALAPLGDEAPETMAYIGANRDPVPAGATAVLRGTLDAVAGATGRIGSSRWIRYRLDLRTVTDQPAEVTLTPIDRRVQALIAAHPDAERPEVAAALRYWDLGLRSGFAWLDGDAPLCMQWLFTSADNDALAAMPVWAGMYRPLTGGIGQVEKLWTFSTARTRGVATKFAYAMYAEARARGLTSLRTHIHESNDAARGWAARTGWTECGDITRYTFNIPGLRGDNAAVWFHRDFKPLPASAEVSALPVKNQHQNRTTERQNQAV